MADPLAFKRLPIIRHIRFFYGSWQVARWNAAWRAMGYIPTGADEKHLQQIWKGKA